MSPRSAEHAQSTVAVITVSYGSETQLADFFASIPDASARSPLVIIADNKAEESVAALADANGAEYISLPQNPGYGGGVNAAARSLPLETEWILVSNPDITFSPGAIDAMVARGQESEDIGSVGPLILTAEGDVYPSARAVPSLRTGVGHVMFARVWPSNPWTRAYRLESDGEPRRRDAGWLSGACVLVRKKIFDEMNGFDDRYFMYFEDVDLGYRIGRLGYRNVYEPTARVVHTGAHSTSTESAVMLRAHHDSAKRFLQQKYAGPLMAPIRWLILPALSARSFFATRSSGK